MSPAILSALILGVTLVLFVSERVRHDLVAILALFACITLGLTTPDDALAGFADPAVIAVAAILVVGRAVELSGVAQRFAQWAMPAHLGFAPRLTMLLVVAGLLSAFMNNIAALVITMPIATQIARASRLPPAATLMPLAFASILGGMTTLIGTPANLILSSVREDALGAPLGFFTMTPVGGAVLLTGLVYLGTIGWRLLPLRKSSRDEARPPWRVFELTVPQALTDLPIAALKATLRDLGSRPLLVVRARSGRKPDQLASLQADDHLLLLSRRNQWDVAAATGLQTPEPIDMTPGTVTARVVVGHGSFLVGLSHEAVRIRSGGALAVVAAGPRAARRRQPLAELRIEAGDQLFVRGTPGELSRFVAGARLLEIDRLDPTPVARVRSTAVLLIFLAAIAAVVSGAASPAIAFLAAAAVLAMTRLLPPSDIYRSIDWSVIILLAAMIPVGRSFETSGAAGLAAQALAHGMNGAPLVLVLAAMCALTLLLSIFLNNVATAIVMGPLAIDAAGLLGVNPDAVLLAVLIGASSDFLTPIGHQNNLLVMGPGGYRFLDYARVGGGLVVLVVATTAIMLSWLYG